MNYSPISQHASDTLRKVRQLATTAEILAKEVLFMYEGPQEFSQRFTMNKAAKTLCAVHCVNDYSMPTYDNNRLPAEEYVEIFFRWLDASLGQGEEAA